MTERWQKMDRTGLVATARAWADRQMVEHDTRTDLAQSVRDAAFYRADALYEFAAHIEDGNFDAVRPADGAEAVHTGQLRDEPDHVADAGKMVSPPSGEVREAEVAQIILGMMVPAESFQTSEVRQRAVATAQRLLAKAPLIPTRDEAALPELSAKSASNSDALPEPVAWRVRCGLNHPLVEGKPFDWRLSEKRPELGEGAKSEWFDIEPLYTDPPATAEEIREPVGEAGSMPGSSGFTMAAFKAADVPIGTKLYAAPQAPAELPGDVVQLVKAVLATSAEYGFPFDTPSDTLAAALNELDQAVAPFASRVPLEKEEGL